MTNRQRMEQFYACAASGDHETVNAMIHPDFIGYEPDGLPYGGVYKGIEGWFNVVQTVFGTWENFTPRLKYILQDDKDEIFAAGLHTTGKVAATGETFDTFILEQWKFKDGLICELRPFYWDTALLAGLHARGKS